MIHGFQRVDLVCAPGSGRIETHDSVRVEFESTTAGLALIGAALVLATSCNFNESRWVLRAWATPARCSLAVRITSRISRPACPAYRRLHEVVILLSSGRV